MHRHSDDHNAPSTLSLARHLLGAVRDSWSSDLNRAVVELVDPQPGEAVLDIGAGLGPAAIDTARRVSPNGQLTAVDPSLAMRTLLRARRVAHPARRNINVRDGSAEHLPAADRSVDAAYAVNAAHHFESLDEAAAEIARVLKPGGRLIIVEEDFANPQHPYERSHDLGVPVAADVTHFAALLTAAGLAVSQAATHQPIADATASILIAVSPTLAAGDQQPTADLTGANSKEGKA